MRMLVVGAYRGGGSDDPGRLLKDLAREPGAPRLELEGLTRRRTWSRCSRRPPNGR